MNDLPDDREELLEGLVGGDLDPKDPAIEARLHDDPELEARWREFCALDQAFGDAASVREEALLAAHRAPATGPGDKEMLQQICAAAPRPSPPEAQGPIRMLLAAAAMLVVALGAAWYSGVFDPSPTEAPGYRWLGSGGITIPDGLPFGTLRLELTNDDPLDAEVSASVYAVEPAGTRGEEIRNFSDFGEQQVELTAEKLAGQDHIEWVIEVRSTASPVPTVHRYRQTR